MKPIRRVWVARAEPGAARTADRLIALGFEPVVGPLLEIRPLEPVVDMAGVMAGVGALAFTSRNGVAAFAGLSDRRSLPVFTVGDATAEAARALGFEDVRSADGALADLAALLAAEAPGNGVVLVPGALEPSGDLAALLPDDIRIRGLPVYEAVETGISAPRGFDAVLIHSPRAGRALRTLGPFAGEVAVAISAAAAGALGKDAGLEIHVSPAPTESGVLETLGKAAHRV